MLRLFSARLAFRVKLREKGKWPANHHSLCLPCFPFASLSFSPDSFCRLVFLIPHSRTHTVFAFILASIVFT